MFLISSLGGLSIIALSLIVNYVALPIYIFTQDPLKQFEMAEVNIIKEVKAETPEEDMREWILDEWERVGQRDNANAIITCESHFNNNAFNINANGTIDLGVYQFNSLHIKSGWINLDEIGDYKKSTKKAIEMWKKKGWSPWYCSKLLKI